MASLPPVWFYKVLTQLRIKRHKEFSVCTYDEAASWRRAGHLMA